MGNSADRYKFHSAMKEMYEMPQATVIEMETEGAVMGASDPGIEEGEG